MAEFTIDISTIQAAIGYKPTATTVDPAALPVVVAVQTQDYSDQGASSPDGYTPSNTTDIYTKDTPGGCYIPGSSLSNGDRYLLRFDGSFGSCDDNKSIRCSLVDNRGGIGGLRIWANACAEGPYPNGGAPSASTPVVDLNPTLPRGLRNGSMSGWIEYTANGTDLQFVFEDLGGPGAACYWRGFTLIAIPITLAFDPTDYQAIAGFAPYINNTSAPFKQNASGTGPWTNQSSDTLPICAGSFTAGASGQYLVLCSGAGSCNGNNGDDVMQYRFMENAVQLGQTVIKTNEDNNDRIPFNFGFVRQYTSGQVVNYELQSKPSDPSGTLPVRVTRTTWHPWIIVLRLPFLAGYDYRENLATNPITIGAIYPAWQTLASIQVTPTAYAAEANGEYVITYGTATVHRATLGNVMCRILCRETGEMLHQSIPVANVNALDNDRAHISCAGAKLANATYTYDFQVCLATATASGTPEAIESTFVAMRMASNLGGVSQYVSIVDDADGGGTGLGTSTGLPDSPTRQIFDTTDPVENADSIVSTSVIPANPYVPGAHPRLWFYNNDRLAYLRNARTNNTPQYAAWVNTSNGYEKWDRALRWVVTQNASDLTAALAQVDTLLTWNMQTIFYQGDGLYYRFAMRQAAIFYDWLGGAFDGVDHLGATRKAKLKDFMLAATYVMYANDTISKSIGGSYGTANWETNDPHSNHFAQQMLGAAYVGIALYGEQPTSFQWPPQSGTVYAFSIPFDNGGSSGIRMNTDVYTDVWQFVKDRIDKMILPVWDVDMADGNHSEGLSNYGLASWNHLAELFNIVDGAALTDYMGAHNCLRKAIPFILAAQQPGRQYRVNLGDTRGATQPWINLAQPDDRDAFPIGLLVDGLRLRNTHEGDLGQYWMNANYPTLPSSSEFKAYWFMLWRDGAGINPDNEPLTFWDPGSLGFFNSKTSQAAGGTCINHLCSWKYKEHQHADCNSLQIFGPDGWIVIDATFKTTNYQDWPSHYHSGCVLYINSGTSAYSCGYSTGPANRYGSAAGVTKAKIDRAYGDPAYGYSRGVADNVFQAYKLGGASELRGILNAPQGTTVYPVLTDNFNRSMFHLLGQNMIVVFDRIKTKAAYTASGNVAEYRWHYNSTNVTSTGGRTRIDTGSTRTYRRTVLKPSFGYSETIYDSSLVGLMTGSSGGTDFLPSQTLVNGSFREHIRIPMDGTANRLCQLFEITSTTQGSMTTNEPIPITGIGLPAGTMEGVTISARTALTDPYTHVLFSGLVTAATPSTVDYYAYKNTSTDQHYVCDLVPGQRYTVVETASGISNYQHYELTPSSTQGFLANSEGILAFRPVDLIAGVNIYPIDINDSTTVNGESTVGTQYTFNISVDDVTTSNSESTPATGLGATTYVQAIYDETTVNGESNAYIGQSLNIADSGSGISYIDTQQIGIPESEEIEKRIDGPIVTMVPVADVTNALFIGIPSDGILWNKVNTTDLDTIIRPNPFPVIQTAEVVFRLSDVTPLLGTIRSIQFGIQIAHIGFDQVDSPFMLFNLYRNNTVSAATEITSDLIELSNSMVPGWYRTSVLPVTVDKVDLSGLIVRLRPRAKAYGASYRIDIATIEVDASGDAPEKVI